MKVILQVTAGPAQGRQIPLQSGERARFGRSDVADVCFADDSDMSDVHFELECLGDTCLVRNMSSSAGTFLNNQPIEEAAIENGDQIVAGQTQLRTVVQGLTPPADAAPNDQAPKPDDPKYSAIELCQMTSLEEESLQLFRPNHTPEQFISVLVEHELFPDVIRILTLYLPKRQAIIWGYRAVKEFFPRDLGPDEQSALEISVNWLKDSSEENRRAAMAIAEQTEFNHAASCIAAAASWSEGSMAPAEFAEVTPDPSLTGKMVSAALLLTATEGDPATINDRYRNIIQLGKQALTGELPLPE